MGLGPSTPSTTAGPGRNSASTAARRTVTFNTDDVDSEDQDEDILGLRQQFHNTVRENIIFLLFFLSLCAISWMVIGLFVRRKDNDDGNDNESSKDQVDSSSGRRQPLTMSSPGSQDDDESVVYKICFWLCVFSLSISMGAALLLPLSILSNEIVLLYPSSYYVQWLDGMLVQGLWNLIFLFTNISLFGFLPFAYFFIESEGFSGNKRGLAAKVQETLVVLVLSTFAILGLAFVLSSVLSDKPFFNFIGWTDQLPFIYSCMSFVGVCLLLLCTPVGAGRLFTVLSQRLVGPQFLRDLEEEHRLKYLEIGAMRSKLRRREEANLKMKEILSESRRNRSQKTTEKSKYNMSESGDGCETTSEASSSFLDIASLKEKWDKNFSINGNGNGENGDALTHTGADDVDSVSNGGDNDDISSIASSTSEFAKSYHRMTAVSPNGSEETEDEMKITIKEMGEELKALDVLRKTPGWKRNLLYPLAFLFVLVLTGITVFMVVINTLQLVVGMKELPLSAQSVSLGLSSISILGSWGAGIEIILIMYLMATSLIGVYSLPGVRKIRPKPGDSPTSHIIYNCGLVLILSSALPLLSRILGITNFDLLGNYGKIEWLGNFYIVFLYNIVFFVALALCLVNKFTSAIRRELLTRLRAAVPLFHFRGRVHPPSSPFEHSPTPTSDKRGRNWSGSASPESKKTI